MKVHWSSAGPRVESLVGKVALKIVRPFGLFSP